MKLESISYRLGSRVVTNEEILEKVASCSHGVHEGDLDRTLDQIEFYLQYSGARTRRWLAPGETPIRLVTQAVDAALEKARVRKQDVELLIHVGLCRGFLEAGQASFVAQAAGMDRVHCFDVMDACNSWARAMFIAYNLLLTGAYRRIMIVNTECNMMEGGIINPSLFRFRRFEDVHSSFAGLTLADGATATLLSKDDTRTWSFRFRSRPDLADLCTVPLDNYQAFSLPSPRLGRNGVHRFAAYAREMQKEGLAETVNCFLDQAISIDELDWIFPHGHSKNVWEKSAQELGWNPGLFKWNTYGEYGNLASACVPTAMAMAEEAGDLLRGQRLMTWVVSSGLSFSTAVFVYGSALAAG